MEEKFKQILIKEFYEIDNIKGKTTAKKSLLKIQALFKMGYLPSRTDKFYKNQSEETNYCIGYAIHLGMQIATEVY